MQGKRREMTEEAPSTEISSTPFGWYFKDTSVYEQSSIRWPSEAPDGIMERLKSLGFTEPPVMQSNRKVWIAVFKRAEELGKGIAVCSPEGETQCLRYAVLLQVSGDYLGDPLFTDALPGLLRLVAECKPLADMFD
jgi:hypothetical protein